MKAHLAWCADELGPYEGWVVDPSIKEKEETHWNEFVLEEV